MMERNRAYETALAALRLERQHLVHPAESPQAYERLLRDFSPVLPVYWCCPGSPPEPRFRAAFDGGAYCSALREKRKLIKGRFQNGSVAYIFADELPLWAAVYRKAAPLSQNAQTLLELLEREGPMTIQLMKQFTGMLAKEITPALHKPQAAFLVFEDQTDNEWDRAWYRFKDVFPEIRLDSIPRQQALRTLLLRFAGRSVRIDPQMAYSFYRLPVKEAEIALERLAGEGELLFDGEGYLLAGDAALLGETLVRGEGPIASVFPLDRNDFLVKSQEHLLVKAYPSREMGKEKWDVLYYLLIDGFFRGAVYGRFRNGPFEVEDIALSLSLQEAQRRREEILRAVQRVCDPERSPVKRYLGQAI